MNEALQKALRVLAMREHSAVELKQKLVRAGYIQTDIEEALTYCQQQGYQNDARFAALFCKVHIAKGHGPLKMAYALKQHGFTQEEIQSYLAEEQVDWVELARRVLIKQGWRFKSSEDHAKQMRFLLARGFPMDVIRLSLRVTTSLSDDR
jgi:regulatory protein